MVTDQPLYQSRTLFRKLFPFSDACLCLSTDCTLEALSTCDWRQINLGMIVTSKPRSPCCSFKSLGIETKVLSSKWSLKKEREKERERRRRRKTSGWHHISLVSIVWPAVFSQPALCERSPSLAPFRCAAASSHGSKLHTFITFTARGYCQRLESLKSVSMVLRSCAKAIYGLFFLHVFTCALTTGLSLEQHAPHVCHVCIAPPSLTTK